MKKLWLFLATFLIASQAHADPPQVLGATPELRAITAPLRAKGTPLFAAPKIFGAALPYAISNALVPFGSGTASAYASPAGNVQFFNGTTDDCGGGVGALCLHAVTTAPSSAPADSLALWAGSGGFQLVVGATALHIPYYATVPNQAGGQFVVYMDAFPSGVSTGTGNDGAGMAALGQTGQGGTSGATGGRGGFFQGSGWIGGSSDTGQGGTGGGASLTAGLGGPITAGTGVGSIAGNGGNVNLYPGPAGLVNGGTGTGGQDGYTVILDHGGPAVFPGNPSIPASQNLMAIGGAGWGGNGLVVNVSAGGTITLTRSQYKYPLMYMTGTLASNTTVVFPTVTFPPITYGEWDVITDGVNLNGFTLSFANGTASQNIIPNTHSSVHVTTYNTNTIICEQAITNFANVQLFNTVNDFGTAASGVFSIGPVTTEPSTLPSTSIAIWNHTGQQFETTSKGLLFSNLITGNLTINQAALASTTSTATAGLSLTLTGQAGQSATSGQAGAVGGGGSIGGGAGGSSDTSTGGTGGSFGVFGGAGGNSTSGGNGGGGGALTIAPGPPGTGGTPGNPGILSIKNQVAGSTLIQIGNEGMGYQSAAPTIATTGTTVLPLTQGYDHAVIFLGTHTLTGNVVVQFPTTYQGYVDTSGITLGGNTLQFSNGTTTSAAITPSTTFPYFVQSRGSGVFLVNQQTSALLPTITLTGQVTGAASGGSIATTLTSANLPAITLTGSVTGSASGGSIATTLASAQLPTITLTGQVTGSASGGSIAATDRSVTTVAASTYAVAATTIDRTLFVNTTSYTPTITLPAPVAALRICVKDATGNATANFITVNPHSTETIDTVASGTTMWTPWGTQCFESDGTNWFTE